MTHDPTAATSCLEYQLVFDDALEVYKMKTGQDLCSYSLFSKLETCDSPDTVLIALQQQIPAFIEPGSSDNNKLTKWLDPTIKVLIAFSSIIGGGVNLVSTESQVRPGNRGVLKSVNLHFIKAYPPAGVIFSGIGVLLSVSVFLEPRCPSLAQGHP